jgi:hypothetical protein
MPQQNISTQNPAQEITAPATVASILAARESRLATPAYLRGDVGAPS